MTLAGRRSCHVRRPKRAARAGNRPGRVRQRTQYNSAGGTNWTFSSQTTYLYDGRRVIQERNGTAPLVAYTRGHDLAGSLEGAGGIGGLMARTHGYSAGTWSTHHYYHADGNGNVTYLVNSSQGLGCSYRYRPYGELLSSSTGTLSASANAYRFSSKEWMNTSGLYYYGYRFYQPTLQRWINRDPIMEEGGVNLYTYAFNEPAAKVDATGLSPSLNPANQAYAGEVIAAAGQVSRTAAQEIAKRCTSNLGKVADKLGRSKKQIEDAVHKVKREAFRNKKTGKGKPGGEKSNPDVKIDPKTGDVYPQTKDGGIGDCIGNIFDHLP
jgi:RHS repeat-associated protein